MFSTPIALAWAGTKAKVTGPDTVMVTRRTEAMRTGSVDE